MHGEHIQTSGRIRRWLDYNTASKDINPGVCLSDSMNGLKHFLKPINDYNGKFCIRLHQCTLKLFGLKFKDVHICLFQLHFSYLVVQQTKTCKQNQKEAPFQIYDKP